MPIMDPMLDIPKNRRRTPVWRICLLMGVTALLFMLIAGSYGGASSVVEHTVTE